VVVLCLTPMEVSNKMLPVKVFALKLMTSSGIVSELLLLL
jgi:hypothetical protein